MLKEYGQKQTPMSMTIALTTITTTLYARKMTVMATGVEATGVFHIAI